MTTLRGKNDFSIVEATHTYFRFGNAHNIVANEETGFIYVVGATQGPGDICAGMLCDFWAFWLFGETVSNMIVIWIGNFCAKQ